MRSPGSTAGRCDACPCFPELEEAANRKISFSFHYAAAGCLSWLIQGGYGQGCLREFWGKCKQDSYIIRRPLKFKNMGGTLTHLLI